MQTIFELHELVRSKIAAGEVIERPAYIAKELIENALDANAKTITIEAYDGGTTKLIVSDDGIGMSKEDLQLCYKRHTTSKLKHEDDLSKVKTMGFRGEALASIAAISQLTIRSRLSDSPVGYELRVDQQGECSLSKKGMPRGTQILVENIFSSVPARQKFLKSAQSEYRLLLELITRYALAFPHIHFELYHEGKRVFSYKPLGKDQRVQSVLGEDVMEFMIPIFKEHEYVKMSGYISKPQLSYANTRNHFIFVNNRFVHDPLIASVLKETYGTLLEPARHPYLLLFLDIPHQLLDINVHPRKEKVYFVDTHMVLDTLREAVKESLQKENLQFIDRRWSGGEKNYIDQWQIRDGGTQTYAANVLKEKIHEKDTLLHEISNKTLSQYHNVYIVSETSKGLLFIDQHAAHERILYEKFMDLLEKELEVSTLELLDKPVDVKVTPQEKAFFEEYKETISKFGFEYEIKRESISVKKVSALWKDRDIKHILRSLLDELFEKEEISGVDAFSKKMVAYLSCRGAVKAGDKLSEDQCRNLIEQLQKAKNQYTCPHGRPIQREIELKYLHTLFKRL